MSESADPSPGPSPTNPSSDDLQIGCRDVAAKIQRGESFRFVDIRTEEFRSARIEGAEPATEELFEELLHLPRETEIIFLCHHGIASLEAAAFFREQGFAHAKSMIGGIAAWSVEVPRH